MAQSQQQPVPSQQNEKEQVKKPTGFRVEEQKRIQINRSHVNRRQRAEVLKVLSIGLFGRRRYKNMYLLASLNNFYHALMIANTLQKRVQKLALVISMDKVKYTEYLEEGGQGTEKQYSTFSIKITRQPSEQDKKHPGFNEGSQKIENPLTEIIKLKYQRRGGDRRRGGRRRNQQRRDGNKRSQRQPRRRDYRQQRQDKRVTRRYEQKGENRTTGRRRPQGQRRDNRGYQRDNRDYRQTEDRRRNNNSYDRQRQDRRQPQRKYRDEEDFDRRPKRYREDKHERVEDDGYRRGQRKTRGGPRNQQSGKVAGHDYDKSHLNRQNNEREERRERAPPRKNNRYSSQEQN